MVSLPEVDLVRTLLNSGYPVILPPAYTVFPHLKDLTPTTGPMVVAGYKVQKLSTSKEALWVRFTSPCEYEVRPSRCTLKTSTPKRDRHVVLILVFFVLSLLGTPKPPRSAILE